MFKITDPFQSSTIYNNFCSCEISSMKSHQLGLQYGGTTKNYTLHNYYREVLFEREQYGKAKKEVLDQAAAKASLQGYKDFKQGRSNSTRPELTRGHWEGTRSFDICRSSVCLPKHERLSSSYTFGKRDASAANCTQRLLIK